MSSLKESQSSSASNAARPNAERRSRLLALAVLVGIALYVLLDIIVQILPPHYSALSQPESDLAVGPFGFLMAINFVIRGLVALALIWALTQHLPGKTLSRGGIFLVGVWGIGALLLSIFPTDLAGAHPTLHGQIHLVVALLAFICGALGELLLSRRLLADQDWRATGQVTMIIALFALLLFVLTALSLAGRPPLIHAFGGLTERLFIGLVLLWMVVIAVRLRRVNAHTTSAEALV